MNSARLFSRSAWVRHSNRSRVYPAALIDWISCPVWAATNCRVCSLSHRITKRRRLSRNEASAAIAPRQSRSRKIAREQEENFPSGKSF